MMGHRATVEVSATSAAAADAVIIEVWPVILIAHRKAHCRRVPSLRTVRHVEVFAPYDIELFQLILHVTASRQKPLPMPDAG